MTTPVHSLTYALDASTGLIKRAVGAAAVTADAYIGDQFDQGAAVLTDMALVVNIEACKVSAGDETYTLRVTGSNATNRSDAEILTTVELGDAGTIPLETVDTAVGGQYQAFFRTEKNGTAFRYIDLHLDVAGTSPSITFSAYFTKRI